MYWWLSRYRWPWPDIPLASPEVSSANGEEWLPLRRTPWPFLPGCNRQWRVAFLYDSTTFYDVASGLVPDPVRALSPAVEWSKSTAPLNKKGEKRTVAPQSQRTSIAGTNQGLCGSSCKGGKHRRGGNRLSRKDGSGVLVIKGKSSMVMHGKLSKKKIQSGERRQRIVQHDDESYCEDPSSPHWTDSTRLT